MFPYANEPNEYWSGYFTSRPNDKANARHASRTLRAYNKMLAKSYFPAPKFNSMASDVYQLEKLLDAVSVHQHHDAITGTDRSHVAADYVRRVNEPMQALS